MRLLLSLFCLLSIFIVSCADVTGVGDYKVLLSSEEQKTPFHITKTLATTVSGKQYYRIPGVVVTDKGAIICVYDNRGTLNSDIGFNNPNVNVTVRRSVDGGYTWSDEANVGGVGTTINTVHGDPLIFKANNGDLVVLSAAGGAWFTAPENPSRVSVSISKDEGLTWSKWRDVIDGDTFKNNPVLKNAGIVRGFMASGRGLTLKKNGRLIGAMLGGNKTSPTVKMAIAVYSDDNGETWKIGGTIKYPDNWNADEPKMIAELNDGRILMSARPNKTGENRVWSYSSDGGDTWTDGIKTIDLLDGRANAEGIRYTSTLKGQSKNRLLFLNCNASVQRTQLTVSISTDEGSTWIPTKVLQSGSACYSSIDVLKDGTIVTFAEEQSQSAGYDNYDIVFRRFNLNWLTDGVESYEESYDIN